MDTNMLGEGDAVVIVDVQNDFCPGGALAIPRGDEVVPVANEWMRAADKAGLRIYLSRDWHPSVHLSFEPQGGEWPPHCIQDTEGAAFHPDLDIPTSAVVVTKGTRFDQDQYSVFDQTGFDAQLERDGVKRLWIGGLAQDVCVCATVLDARELGYEVHLIPGASLPVTREGGDDAIRKMRDAGARLGDAA